MNPRTVCFVIKEFYDLEKCGVYFRWSVSHALYRLACKLLALSVLASPLREQGPSNRVRYGTPSGVITGPSLGRPSRTFVTKGHTFTAIDHDHQSGLLRVRQAVHPVPQGRPGLGHCVRTLNGLLGRP
jgi:hypothetical protein